MQTIRPAGLNERRCITRESLGLYGCVVTIGTYKNTAATANHLAKDDVVRALKHCVVKHPVLCTIILDAESERPQLARALEMDLSEHMRIVDGADAELDEARRIQHLLETAHNEPFGFRDVRPQWRVYINQFHSSPACFDLVFATSHALVDGISGSLFHSTFLEAVRDMKKFEFDANPIWTVPSGLDLLPPLERAAEFPISWSFLLRPAVKEFLPSWLARVLGFGDEDTKDTWLGAPTRPERSTNDLLPTAVRVALVSALTLQRILQICKGHKARLTGLLNHLTARALAQALHSRGLGYTKFIAQTPTDLRKCIPSARNQMANYNSVVSETIEIPPTPKDSQHKLTEEDWKAIQRSNDILAAGSNTLADQPIALLRYVSNIREWMLKNAKKPASESFGMSNQGVFEGSPRVDSVGDQSWAVERMVFSQSADGFGAPFNLNVASVRNGPLVLTLTWWPGMLGVDDEKVFVEEVLGSVMNELERIASNDAT